LVSTGQGDYTNEIRESDVDRFFCDPAIAYAVIALGVVVRAVTTVIGVALLVVLTVVLVPISVVVALATMAEEAMYDVVMWARRKR